jgi:hypothetical protein
MSPRLLSLLSLEHAPPCARDCLDAQTAAARMPGRRWPRWARNALVTA